MAILIYRVIIVAVIAGLAACSTSKTPPARGGRYPCVYQPMKKGGAFYKEDGPGGALPHYIDSILEPVPIVEPLHRFANRPYTILGKNYVPHSQLGEFVQEGVGSWYGRKFHGQKTSSGERYDMYAMTAAHPTLPIPSYVRVTNKQNGRQIVVRINDRGPFHKDRVIDLSFLAACRLGYAMDGSGAVKVESVLPGRSRVASAHPRLIGEVAQTEKVPLIEQRGTIFVQLGAFVTQGSADSFRHKVAEMLNQPIHHIHLHASAGIVRVRMGPFSDKYAALKEAERLTGEHQIKAMVVHEVL